MPPQGPTSHPWAAALQPGTCSTPKLPAANHQLLASPTGHPKCFRTQVLGVPAVCAAARLLGGSGAGRVPMVPGLVEAGGTAHAPSAGRGSLHAGVSLPQLQPVEMLSWRWGSDGGSRAAEMPVPSPHGKETAKLKLGPGPQGPGCGAAPAPQPSGEGRRSGCRGHAGLAGPAGAASVSWWRRPSSSWRPASRRKGPG